MQASLIDFIQVLRTHELRVSPAETLDAMAVATALGYADRGVLRDGLAMALAKSAEEEAIFLRCFDRFFRQELPDFSGGAAEAEVTPGTAPDPLALAGAGDPQLQAALASPLLRALLRNDRNALTLAMGRAAERAGLRQIRMVTQKGQFTRRMLDEMGEEQIRGAILALERRQRPALPALQRYRDLLREQVRDYVEREYLKQAEGRNRQFMDEILSGTRLNNIEQVYLQRVHELVRRMARKLAARHARRRRTYRRGRLDMARTLRRGIPHDGVMFNTCWRRVRRDRPQILAVCDVSGSVAAYAKFLLLFLYSLQDVLPRVRSFAFSSHLGEVSELFEQYPVEQAIEQVNRQYGGATDYGSALRDFARLALDAVGGNTTVIVLGDARNNNGDPRLEIMQGLYRRARQVIWLNPESRRAWGTGDSEMLRYQSACHFSAECNNLRQLERIVDQLLRSTR
jgi:uncharacterized protein with von Willebrand factor type A (vWA) domain